MQVENGPNFNQLNEKVKYLDDMLKKDIFSNPVREVQENIRNELLEFRQVFCRNLEELDNYLVGIYYLII
jgi:hypothetical protein